MMHRNVRSLLANEGRMHDPVGVTSKCFPLCSLSFGLFLAIKTLTQHLKAIARG